MPLNRPENYNMIDAPYELKVSIVEHNCTGCPYFKEASFDDIDDILVKGCFYPTDIKDMNPYLTGGYLSVIDIAHNSCSFWRNRLDYESPIKVDSAPSEEEWCQVPAIEPNWLLVETPVYTKRIYD